MFQDAVFGDVDLIDCEIERFSDYCGLDAAQDRGGECLVCGFVYFGANSFSAIDQVGLDPFAVPRIALI